MKPKTGPTAVNKHYRFSPHFLTMLSAKQALQQHPISEKLFSFGSNLGGFIFRKEFWDTFLSRLIFFEEGFTFWGFNQNFSTPVATIT